jgi:hypothetical protein
MMRDERLRALNDPRQIADAQLICLSQSRGKREPSRIGKRPQPITNKHERRTGTVRNAKTLGDIEVEAEKIATFVAHKNILTVI